MCFFMLNSVKIEGSIILWRKKKLKKRVKLKQNFNFRLT